MKKVKQTSLIISLILFVQSLGFAQINDPSLVSHYLFNGDLDDISAYQNNGISKGNVIFGEDRFGNQCGAIEFNGHDAYVEVPTSPSLESPSTSLSISTWFKTHKDAHKLQWFTVVCKGNDSKESAFSPHYRLQGTSMTLSLNTEFTENKNLPIKNDVWYHYAMTWDGNEVIGYWEGKEVIRMPYSGSLQPNSSNLEIGRDVPGALEYFHGSLDELMIFNRALDAKEVLKIYQNKSEKNSSKPCGSGPVVPPVNSIPPVVPVPPVVSQVKAPDIKIVIPKQIPLYTDRESQTVWATINHVTSDKDVEVVVNGNKVNDFLFDPDSRLFELVLDAAVGVNSIQILASNQVGQAEAELQIIYQPAKPDLPVPNVPKPAVDSVKQSPLPDVGKVVLKKEIVIPNADVTILCFDHNKIDGDEVSVILDGKILFDHITLDRRSKKAAVKRIKLKRWKTYTLISKAWNEGSIPTNTMSIEINDGQGFVKVVRLNSKKGVSEAIQFKLSDGVTK